MMATGETGENYGLIVMKLIYRPRGIVFKVFVKKKLIEKMFFYDFLSHFLSHFRPYLSLLIRLIMG